MTQYQCKRCGEAGRIVSSSDRPECPNCDREMWPSRRDYR